VVAGGVTLLALSGCEKNRLEVGVEIPAVKAKLELKGPGLGNPRTYSYAQLAALKTTRLDNVLMQKSHEDDELTSWQGPALAQLLAEAGLKPGPMKLTLVAEDEYEIDMTLAEARDAIVALKDGEGRWLARDDDGEGCFLRFVPPHEPGNFWIMNLVEIRVEPAAATEP
jgi:hypothetical protein